MLRLRTFVLLFLLAILVQDQITAKRFGGGGGRSRGGGSHSSSRGGGWFGSLFSSRGSSSSKSTGTTAHVQRPIGFVNPQTSHSFSPPKPPVHETIHRAPVQHSVNSAFGAGTQRPIGFVDPHNPSRSVGNPYQNPYKPSAPKEVHETVQKAPPQQSVNSAFNSGTQRPIGFVDPYNPSRSVGSTHNNPYKPSAPKEVHDSSNKATYNTVHTNPYRRGYNSSSGGYGVHDPMHQSAGQAPLGNAPPPYGYGTGYQHNYGGGYQPGGYGYGHSYPRNDYSSWYHQPYSGGTTHINYGPVNYMQGGYPSYGSSYHYTSSDVGSGALGFFLGYGLGRITSPSYSFGHYNPSSTYHYDHYTVHHYYHNKETIPQQLTVPPNTVVACVGNSSLLCPPNTAALCMSNGTIMCVAKPETLIRCPDNSGAYCVQSAIPNLNTTATTPTAGQNNVTNTTIINIPCISNATLYGNLTYQNNSIVLQDGRNLTVSNNTTNTTHQNATLNNTVAILPPANENNPIVFCITVIAEPAVKKPDAAVLYDKIRGNALHFFTKALGAD